MSDTNHRKSAYHKRNITMMFVILGLFSLSSGLLVVYRNYTRSDAQLKTVHLSSLHPTYESTESMLLSSDAALIVEAVVADDGKVTASPRSGDNSAPPRVSTVYQVEVEKIIKGHIDSKTVTISLMGGIFDNTNYIKEGVPKLRKGDRIVCFASRGDDGKYYPLSGSTAIAQIDNAGRFTLTSSTISGEKRSSTVQGLEVFAKGNDVR